LSSELNYESIKKSVSETLDKLEAMKQQIQALQDQLKAELENTVEKLMFTDVRKDDIKEFLEEPYVLIPKRENEWYVIVPKWINFQIGWLERTTKSYNIFVVNKYVKWFAEIPKTIETKLRLPEPKPFKVFDGMLLTGREHQDEAFQKYRNYVQSREGEDRLRIKKGMEFKLIAKLIEDGTLPFVPRPVLEEDLRPFDGIKLRSYQEQAWKEFLEKGAIGCFWPFGSGKSFFGLYALGRIKGRKLVVVPTLTLKEQWLRNIETYIPRYKYEIDVVTYHAYDKVKNKEYTLAVFDECLTENTFICDRFGNFKSIKEIQNGEQIVGGKVENKFSRNSNEIIRIHSDSILETTRTHPNFVIPKEKIKFDKHKKQMKLPNEEDVELKCSEDLKVGDYLLYPIFLPHTVTKNWSPEQLAFVGMIMTDGHIHSKGNTIRVSVRKDKEWFRKTFKEGLKSFGFENLYKEKVNSRGDLNIWCDSKELKELLINKFGIKPGRKANSIDINEEIILSSLNSIAKFIDSIFCCDGWVGKRKIFLTSTSFNFIQKTQLLLKKFGIHSRYRERKPTKKGHLQYQLEISGSDIETFRKFIRLSMERKQALIDRIKVKSFVRNIKYNGIECRLAKIKKIERTNGSIVYDFTSNPSNKFIANGCLTHNCQHLPADTFVRLATIRAKYRLGFSGSPYREDGRENYIIALTGFPIGMAWEELIKMKVVKVPTFRVYILPSERAKLEKLGELLRTPEKTIIFCDWIELGEKISKMFGIPFVYGATRERLDVIKESQACVVSRVGDEGISLPDIERVIEVAGLYASRMQESQRFGRLMHSREEEPEHIILMTEEEYEKYNKRLYAITERGFKIEFVR